MAFVIGQISSFKWAVTIPRLRENGTIDKPKVMFKFRKLNADELSDYELKDADMTKFASALEKANGDKDLAMILLAAEEQSSGRTARKSSDKAGELLEILEGWEDVATPEGPLEFNSENLEKLLLSEPPAYQAIKAAFREANSGGEAKRKNS